MDLTEILRTAIKNQASDVIISAGWTMSAVEIEDTLLKHDDVDETAVIGVPDPLRGHVVKAFIVSGRCSVQEAISARMRICTG